MKVYKTSAPGYPTRGFRHHVPMAPEGEAAGGTTEATTAATTATTATTATNAASTTAAAATTTAATTAATTAVATDDDPKALIAAMKAEREALATRGAELDKFLEQTRTGLSRERAVERRKYVRDMTLALPMTDEQLDAQLAAIGDVDARTDAGKAAINKWREANSTFFRGPAPAAVLNTDEIVAEIVGGKENLDRKIFGGKAALSMIAATKKSDFAS